MDNNPIGALMQNTMESVKNILKVDTVVGDPIYTPDGITLVPISKISVGFGGGGVEFTAKKSGEDRPYGGGNATAGEQEFYAERGFQNEPQRCKACRDARKNAARGPREYFTATCAACGGEAKVPFEPKSDRPVYCSECFAKMREQA